MCEIVNVTNYALVCLIFCLKNCVCGFILTNIKSDRTQEWFEFGLTGARDICNRLTNKCYNFDRSLLTACTFAQIYVSTYWQVDSGEWLTGWQGKTMQWSDQGPVTWAQVLKRRRRTTMMMMMKLCNCSVGGKHVCLNQLSSPLAVAPPDRLFWRFGRWEWCPCLCLCLCLWRCLSFPWHHQTDSFDDDENGVLVFVFLECEHIHLDSGYWVG